MITESKVNESLTTLFHEVGIPHEFYSDNAKALIQGDYCKKVNNMRYIPPKLNLIHHEKQWRKEKKIVKKLGRYFIQSTDTHIVL